MKTLNLENVKIYTNAKCDIVDAMNLIGEEVYLSDDENFRSYREGHLLEVKYANGVAYPFLGGYEIGSYRYFILAKDAKFIEGSIESSYVEYLVDINEPISKTFVNGFPTPIRPGYAVINWTKSPTDATAESLNINMVWTSIAYETRYYAHYAPLTYNVSYSTGVAGNEVSQVIPNTNNVAYGNTFVLPGEVYSWSGHKQVGWYMNSADKDSDGVVYAREVVNGEEIPKTMFPLGATVKNLTNQQGFTVELIAMWDEFDNFYYIRFNKSTPSSPKAGEVNIVDGEMPDQLMPINTAAKINENKYTLKGYKFSHWITGTGVKIYDNDMVSPLTKQEEQIIDVYAVWTNQTYYWEYKFPANTTNVGTTSFAAVYDRSITVPNVTYTNEVYQIWGWSLTEDNTNYETYAEAQSHIITSANVSSIICRGDAVLYPICKKLLAEIKYVTEDGQELQLENMPTFIRVGQEVKVPIPTRETLKQTQQRTEQYLDFYNNKRLHLGIQFMTPLQKCSQGLELN